MLCILKGGMPFKMHKIIFFKKKIKKYVCLLYLKFSDLLPETHLFFFIRPKQTLQTLIKLLIWIHIVCNIGSLRT